MAGMRTVVRSAAAEAIRHLPPDIKRAVKAAIRQISANPAAGESLQRELEGLRKYRVRRFRIVYQVDRARRIVDIMAVGERRSIYEEVANPRRSQE